MRCKLITAAAIIAIAGCTSQAPTFQTEDQIEDTISTENNEKAFSLIDTKNDMPISKGVIRSENEISIFSHIEGQLNEVTIDSGASVKKGQVLFTLDDQLLRANVNLKEAALDQAEVRMEEILIGQGYKRQNLDNVPEETRRYAYIKSGCNVCEAELEIAKNKLNASRIVSPATGVIAKLSATSYAYVNPGESLCVLIDSENLFVEFYILETEMRKFHLGSPMKIYSVAYPEVYHEAIVRSIGTVVDASGMIRVEASLKTKDNLMPGMTVLVKL